MIRVIRMKYMVTKQVDLVTVSTSKPGNSPWCSTVESITSMKSSSFLSSSFFFFFFFLISRCSSIHLSSTWSYTFAVFFMAFLYPPKSNQLRNGKNLKEQMPQTDKEDPSTLLETAPQHCLQKPSWIAFLPLSSILYSFLAPQTTSSSPLFPCYYFCHPHITHTVSWSKFEPRIF